MADTKLDHMLAGLAGIVERTAAGLAVKNEPGLVGRMDGLVHDAVFGEADAKAAARWIVWEAAQALGIRPASIHSLYMAVGRGEVGKIFTVPAINLRMIAYDSARAVFRAAVKHDVSALIFEIARSEIGYTDQRPSEYASAVLAAAIREGFRGPLFIQGDHFQTSAKKYAAEPAKEIQAIRDLILEAIDGGFYNIDIDSSTLVDLSRPTLVEQQKLNFEVCADFTRFIRTHEPAGVTVSIGGEIGEVGQKNSSPEDLDAFMSGYNALKGNVTGISKISIQTGTSHGGVVLPDGTLAKVAIDFEVLKALGAKARKEYAMGGAVQHGASTLPEQAFHKFVEAGTCEVHLATAFQNLVMDHPAVPEALREETIEWLKVHTADERKPKDTEAQFLYKTRKKSIGPFKERFWRLPAETRAAIGADLERTFTFLFGQLGVGGTREIAAKFVHAPAVHKPAPVGGVEAVKGEHVGDLAD
jgi:fructose/tagatose bisphosphate aldolase